MKEWQIIIKNKNGTENIFNFDVIDLKSSYSEERGPILIFEAFNYESLNIHTKLSLALTRLKQIIMGKK